MRKPTREESYIAGSLRTAIESDSIFELVKVFIANEETFKKLDTMAIQVRAGEYGRVIVSVCRPEDIPDNAIKIDSGQ